MLQVLKNSKNPTWPASARDCQNSKITLKLSGFLFVFLHDALVMASGRVDFSSPVVVVDEIEVGVITAVLASS